ncbi:MAG: autotransporter-associated beta strand repeat-containing protein [Ferruginibacter sp.]
MKRFLLESKLSVLMLIISGLLFANTTLAKSTTWTPTTGGAWTTAGNWSNGLPVAGDDVIINSNQSAAITAVPSISLANLTISGNCNLVPSAAGNTLTITGSLSVSASITVSLGTNGATRFNLTLGSASVSTVSGTLNVYSSGTNGAVTVNGDLTLASTGILADGGGANNTDLSVAATGILRIGSVQGISTTAATGNIRLTGTRTYTVGSEIVYNGTAAQVTGNAMPTTSDITINNTNGVALSGAYTGTGTLTMTAGTLDMANNNLSVGALTGSSNITNASGAAGNRTLSVTGSASPAAYSGIISNGTATSVSLTKSGTGTLNLTGINTYTGVTTINAGVLAVPSIENGGVAGNMGAASGAAGNIVLGGGTLRYTGFTASTNRNFTLTAGTTSTIEITQAAETLTISGASTATNGALTKSGAGTLVLSGANLYTGTTTVTAGTLQHGVNNALASGAVTVNGGTWDIATFTDAVGAVTLTSGTISGTTGVVTGTSYTVSNGTVSAILAGAVNLNKTTTGTVTLSGLNTYTGTTTISDGTLSINSIQNVSGGASAIGAPTTVPNGTITLVTGTSVLRYTGAGHSSNRVIATNTDGSTIDASGTGTLTLSGGVNSGGGNDNLELTGTGSAIMNGVIATGSGTLDKTGTGTWTLGAANTYTGTTTVSAGSLEYGINNAISTGAVTVSGGTLDIKTFTDAVGAVTLTSGNILGTTGTLTGTSYAVQSGNITANLAGAGATLTKTTTGTVTMSGNNTFTGAKTLSAGTLIAGSTTALGTTAGTLNLNGATLNLSTDASISAYNVVVGATSTIVSNRATAGAGVNHTFGTLSIGNFILNETVGANVNSGTAGLTFGATNLSAATPRFDVATGAEMTLGAVSGNFAFTKQNAGVLNLNSASARTSGTVTVSGGTLSLGNISALGTTAVPVQLNGGTLNLATDASVSAYNVTVGGSSSVIANRATSGAAITHTLGTLSIGNFQLTSSYGGNNASGTAGLVFGATTLSAAAPVFDVENNVNLTLGALSGNFAFSKQNNGLMLLNSASARTGGTVTINTGSIRLGNASALGTAAVPVVINNGAGLNLAINTSVNAHPVTINGNAQVVSNLATSGSGITHTLGALTVGAGATLTAYTGDNVPAAIGGLTFGATTLNGTAVFDILTPGLTTTLGAVSGNFAFTKESGGVLALNTASARTAGTVTVNNGTLSVGAASALGTAAVPVQMNGGTLDLASDASINAHNTTIAGNATIVSNRATAGAGITHVLGTLNIGANTLNINKGANATSGIAAVQFGNLTMTGAPVLNTTTADLVMAGNATGAFKLTKTGAGTLQKITTAWTLGADFEITGGVYDATTQNTTLLGDWLNNGGSYAGTGAANFIFNGTTGQSIGGTTSTTFNNLTIDNAAGVTLGTSQAANAAVTINNGNLVIPVNNTLTINNGNAIGGSGFSASKGIVTQVNTTTGAKGFVRVNNMATSTAYTLPVSDGTYYLPVTLTPSDVTANNTYSVCVFPGITDNGEPNGVAFSTAQKNNCVDAVWTVNYNGPGAPTAASVDMVVGWPASLEGVNFAGYSDVVIGIAHWDGPLWGQVVGIGDNTNNTATRTNITQFSPFGVGRIDPTGGVLAIKINYFNASKATGYNVLNWQASCSSAQAIFELERSVDGVNFMNINSITATQARCASPFSYNDFTAPAGTVFYRIKIIDVDGKISYSAIVKLSNQVKDIELSGVQPNPVVNIAQIKVNTTKKEVVGLMVTASDGKVVYRNSVQLQAGSSIINVDMTNLPTGVYMINGVFADGQSNTIRFLKQ